MADLVDEWESDDDDATFFLALDLLEEQSFLRIEDGEVLFSAKPTLTEEAAAPTVAADEELMELVKRSLTSQPRWADGEGIKLMELKGDISAWQSDEQDDAFYDAIDALEEAGWLRVENGEFEDQLFATETGVTAPPSVPPPASNALQEKNDAAEAEAAKAVLRACSSLKRFGIDAKDAERLPALRAACSMLRSQLDRGASSAVSLPASGSAAGRIEPRLVGDWQLIGTTSPDFCERQGVTGLGSAPFTSPLAVFYSYGSDGSVTAKEVLEFFGNPILVNELRGRFGFDESGAWLQEQYSAADLSGVADSPQVPPLPLEEAHSHMPTLPDHLCVPP